MKLNKCKCDRCHKESTCDDNKRKVKLRFEKELKTGTFYVYCGEGENQISN